MISNVKLFPVKGNKTVKARGSAVIANAVKVNFTVINGSKGLFVSLPSRSYQDKESGQTKYVNEVSIPDKELYTKFQNTILAEFKKSQSVPVGEESHVADDGIPF